MKIPFLPVHIISARKYQAIQADLSSVTLAKEEHKKQEALSARELAKLLNENIALRKIAARYGVNKF